MLCKEETKDIKGLNKGLDFYGGHNRVLETYHRIAYINLPEPQSLKAISYRQKQGVSPSTRGLKLGPAGSPDLESAEGAGTVHDARNKPDQGGVHE